MAKKIKEAKDGDEVVKTQVATNPPPEKERPTKP